MNYAGLKAVLVRDFALFGIVQRLTKALSSARPERPTIGGAGEVWSGLGEAGING